MPTPANLYDNGRIQALTVSILAHIWEYADAQPVPYTPVEVLCAVKDALRGVLQATQLQEEAPHGHFQ